MLEGALRDTLARQAAAHCRTDGTAEQVPLTAGLPSGWRLVPARAPHPGG